MGKAQPRRQWTAQIQVEQEGIEIGGAESVWREEIPHGRIAIAVGITIADAVVIDVAAFQLTGLVVKVQFCSWWGSEDLERKLKVKSGIGEIFALTLPAGDIGRGCSAGAGQVRRQVGGFQRWGNLRRRRDWLRGVRVL